MSRSRRLPPLFEVMRETNPQRSQSAPTPVVRPAAPPPPPVAKSIPGAKPAALADTPPASPPTPASSPQRPAPLPDLPAAAATMRAPSGPPQLSLRQPTPDVEEADEPADAPSADSGPLDLNRTFSVPARTLLIAVGGVLAVLVIVWTVAWKLGENSGSSKYLSTLEPDPGNPGSQQDPGMVIPGSSDQGAVRGPGGTGTPTQQQQAGPTRQTTGTPPAGGDRTARQTPGMTPTPPPQPSGNQGGQAGAKPADPRGTGLNYLWVETVRNLGDADGIVAFLEANGLPAIAVPRSKSDIPTARAKNEQGWEVVILEGIPGNQFSATASRRSALVQRVKTLGQQLAREGKSDYRLASPEWKRY